MNEGIKLENEEAVRGIIRAVNSIKFGYVQVTVQDSRVTQIEKTEKIRLVNPSIKNRSFVKP